jgi:hypothetical protein
MTYEPNPDPTTLFQGDILSNFILPEPPDKALIARPTIGDAGQNPSHAGETVRVFGQAELTDAFHSGKEAVLVEATLSTVAVLSQSCDVQRKAFLTVAAVRPMRLIQSEQRKSEIRRADRVFENFGLPPTDDFEESFVDLTLLYSVRRENLIAHLPNRLLSMTNLFRQTFQWAIVQYFGRPAV